MASRQKEKPKTICKICGKEWFLSQIKRHLTACRRRRREGTLFECDYCKRTYAAKRHVQRHIREVHIEPINCPHPGCEAVIKKNHLRRHVRMVHDRLKEQCESCGKAISHGNLIKHLKLCTHEGPRKFMCGVEGCDKAFKTAASRHNHNKKVHTERIKCPIENCNSQLKKYTLPVHYKMVHDKVKEQCTNCGKKLAFGTFKQHFTRCLTRPYRLQKLKTKTDVKPEIQLTTEIKVKTEIIESIVYMSKEEEDSLTLF